MAPIIGASLKRLIYILGVEERYIEDALDEVCGLMMLNEILPEDFEERASELLFRTGNVTDRGGFFCAEQTLTYRKELFVEVTGGLVDFISRLQIDLRFAVLYGVFVDFVIDRQRRNNKTFGNGLDPVDLRPDTG